jgi:cytoskeletal protein RodZ
MSTVGQELRKARETQKLTLTELAEITKIRSDHLEALEQNRFDVFPAGVYLRGSIRTYATVLKLDVPAVMGKLDSELSQKKGLSQSPSEARSRGLLDFTMLQFSKLNWKTSLGIFGGGLLVLVVVGSYFVWRHYRTTDPLKNLKPGLYQSTQTYSGQTLPLPNPKK